MGKVGRKASGGRREQVEDEIQVCGGTTDCFVKMFQFGNIHNNEKRKLSEA